MSRAETYVGWRSTYSNEAFDRAAALAYQLTDEDRAAGRPAPRFGYSREAMARAEAIVCGAQR